MKILPAALIFLGMLSPAAAHEYWLEAPSHSVQVGGQVGIGIFVGSDLTGQQMPYLPRGFRSLQHFAPGAEGAFVQGRIGSMPAIALSDLDEGLHIIAQETRDSRLTYTEAGKFETFLRAEGLDHILTEHAERGLPEVGFGETYSRSAKALVGVGNAEGDDFEVGLPVELVALDNPFTTYGDVQIQSLVQGEPAAYVRINLFHRNVAGVVSETHLTTNEGGIANAPDLGTGFYLANAVHMDPVRDLGPTAWHSSWASLSWSK
ncbi:protein of unknown function [Monaibacterium marinum]|uniref:Nickel transport protein n=1 Tax=Pontivivens marinum TaxID=1690039 RepID=A0A2C9CT95_9RHOB|nr:DUF4198 domain-containing protein [Monaibacterium marinum]SOH94385.1 protein of unknown function [Monaibacterium marinum]